MARLIAAALVSLDGYTVDESGRFDWATPTAEVHRHVNALERELGTVLYGRRMYEVMRFWEDVDTTTLPPAELEYAEIWRGLEKVVYSATIDAPTTARTRVEREFDPAAVRRFVDDEERDVGIGGATLAAGALRAGIVDELQLYVFPVITGGGTPILPTGHRIELTLIEGHRFAGGGVVLLRYATPRTDGAD